MADPATGELLGRPVTIVTDNGGPFRSERFARFIDRPDLHHVRTRVRSPGQNGSRERGFGTLKYEKLLLDEITDGIELQALAEAYRIEYNKIRPTSSCPGTGPTTSTPAPHIRPSPTFQDTNLCHLLDARHPAVRCRRGPSRS